MAVSDRDLEIIFQDWIKTVGKKLDDVIPRDTIEELDPAFRIPSDWNQQRLVRLNAAVMALHLLAARISFNTLPGMMKDQLETAARRAGEFIGRRLLRFFGVAFLNLLATAGQFLIEYAVDLRLEKNIRQAGFDVENDLHDKLLLNPNKRQKHKSFVETRHRMKLQRHRNKGWVPWRR